MKRIYKFRLCVSLAFTLFSYGATAKGKYVTIDGKNLVQPDGMKLFIIGTNLGNWLNPEGYMFGFTNTNSARMINQMFCELVGPDFTADFWKQFNDELHVNARLAGEKWRIIIQPAPETKPCRARSQSFYACTVD